MTILFDEKGKIYTNVIAKEAIPATIQTLTHCIHGYIYIRQDERVIDEMDRPERFLAVTDAFIYDLHGVEIYRTGFLALNRDHIIWLVPDEEIRGNRPSSGTSE